MRKEREWLKNQVVYERSTQKLRERKSPGDPEGMEKIAVLRWHAFGHYCFL